MVAGCTAINGGTDGYWLASANGQVYPFGSASDYGSLVSLGVTPSSPIVGIAATADCKGYWLVANDGGLFAFGDAHYYGLMGGMPINKPVVGMTSTPQGGYYEVASDGGLFTFGPGTTYHGSMGGQPLAGPVVGMAETPQGGYYEVASDGGLFTFGPGADFHGSMGGQHLNKPVVGMAVDPTGGYYEVGSEAGPSPSERPTTARPGASAWPSRSWRLLSPRIPPPWEPTPHVDRPARQLAAASSWPATAACSASATPPSPAHSAARGSTTWWAWSTRSGMHNYVLGHGA